MFCQLQIRTLLLCNSKSTRNYNVTKNQSILLILQYWYCSWLELVTALPSSIVDTLSSRKGSLFKSNCSCKYSRSDIHFNLIYLPIHRSTRRTSRRRNWKVSGLMFLVGVYINLANSKQSTCVSLVFTNPTRTSSLSSKPHGVVKISFANGDGDKIGI